MGARAELSHQDHLTWKAHVRVDKFTAEDVRAWQVTHGESREPTGDELLAFTTPYEVFEDDGNLLTTAGLNRLTSLMAGLGGQAWDATHTRIGVGNGTTAAAVGDTDLSAAAGATNRQFVLVDATYPTQSNGVYTARATFGTTLANFAWNEWCIDNGLANGITVVAVMLNHKVIGMGTKTSALAWVFTVTVTLT